MSSVVAWTWPRPLWLLLVAVLALVACGDQKNTGRLCDQECIEPPAPVCDGDERIVYSPLGTCAAGTCVYPESRQRCEFGCNEGACLPEPTACSGVTCGTPPRDFCDGEFSVQYEPEGTCSEALGRCVYTERRTECTGDLRCFDGDCREPSCDFISCDEPPPAACDEAIAVSYAPRGVCDPASLDCRYQEVREDCGARNLQCADGACVEDAACVGVACNRPPAAVCEGEVAVRPRPVGSCALGVCSYETDRLDCAADGGSCVNGACVNPCLGLVCETPPPGRCEATVAIGFTSPGTCDEGACEYEETRFDCAEDDLVCDSGRCIPDPLCAGVPCNTPPAPSCQDGVAVFFEQTGVCARGLCTYARTEENCTAAGLRCDGGECVQPCEGIVCIEPPDDFCVENVAFFSGGGTCVDGGCQYESFSEDCSLTGTTCRDGFCRGTCTTESCITPPDAFCDGSLAVTFASGGFCLDNRCVYSQDLVDCAETDSACYEGQCLPLCPTGPCIEPPEPICDGDRVVAYADIGECLAGSVCEYAETLTDCTITGQICDSGECVDPCFSTVCEPAPSPTCEGEIRVEFGAPATCENGVCSYGETRVDCTDSGRVCNEGACVDPCIGILCLDGPDAVCDGSDVLNYNVPGICTAGACTYNPVRTDCAAFGLGCAAATCVDLCIDAPPCGAPPSPTCDGETLITYNGDGVCQAGSCVFPNTSTLCTDFGLTCRDGACVDACDGLSCDAPPPATCDADDALSFFTPGTCALGLCSYTNARTQCAESNSWCVDGDCVDACTEVSCPTRTDSLCEGTLLRTYLAAPAACVGGACSYATSLVDCADSGDVCVEGACVDPLTACGVLDCAARPVFCDGDVVVEDIGPAVCDPIAGQCDRTTTEVRTPCGAGQGCVDGACARVPQPGELVITEVFVDAAGTDLGREWLEVLNVSAAPLELQGVRIQATASLLAFSIDDPLVLPAGGYAVFASSPTAVPSPTLVYAFEEFNLRNRIDGVRVLRNGVTIDEVRFDATSGWSVPTNRALQLSSGSLNVDANNSPAAWCAASDVYAPLTDARGTPGAANRSCP